MPDETNSYSGTRKPEMSQKAVLAAVLGALTIAIAAVMPIQSDYSLIVVALIVGAMLAGADALRDIRLSEGKLRGRWLAGSAVATPIILAGLVISHGILFPPRSTPYGCLNNLHQIGLGLNMYLNDSRGAMPERLDAVAVGYLGSPATVICPQDRHPFRMSSGLECSYRYVGSLPPGTDGQVIIAADKPGNHWDGYDVLYLDGHAKFLSNEDFMPEMKKSLELVRKNWAEISEARKPEIGRFYLEADKKGRGVE